MVLIIYQLSYLRRVGKFGPATIGRKVKSEGSYSLIYSLF